MGSVDLDGRSDIYSLGCVLYEMLFGAPPGKWSSRQSVSAGHLQDTPPEHRERLETLPRSLERVLVRTLAERPDDRFQNAKSLSEALASHTLDRRSLVERVGIAGTVGLYFLAAVIALGVTRFLVLQLGLPDWAQHGVAVLLLVGLLPVSCSAIAEVRTGRTVLRRWFNWRRTAKGAAVAFTAWGGIVALYMAMRTFGVGPMGTLLGTGVFQEREHIILSDFENHTSDTLLAAALTEVFRIDLAQSPTVTLVEPDQVSRALVRMERSPANELNIDLAREVALREGARAVIAGEINTAGSGFILSARIVSAESGETLAAHREAARDSSEVIRAIDRLSRGLRSRIGESLRSVRASDPLEQVTTASLDALRRYSQAMRAGAIGDQVRSADLLREAIALDSTFAMAYRRLALSRVISRAEQQAALARAYELRDRLSERERLYVLGTYYSMMEQRDQAVATYRRLIETYPDDITALTNLAYEYLDQRDFASAEPLYRRVVQLDSLSGLYGNLIIAQVALDHTDEARQTIERFHEMVPGHGHSEIFPILMAVNDGYYDSAEVQLLAFKERHRDNLLWSSTADDQLAQLALLQGRLEDAQDHFGEALAGAEQLGIPHTGLQGIRRLARIETWFRDNDRRALAVLDSGLAAYPIEDIPIPDRPYVDLAELYAVAGRPDRSRALMDDFDAVADPRTMRANDMGHQQMAGWIALAEDRPDDAVEAFRAADQGMCPICLLPMIGVAYDLANQADSTVAIYERYLETPWVARIETDMLVLPSIYERLGQLYAARGDAEAARDNYTRFIQLWENADPELRPRVAAARTALESLAPDR
jgi:tetratricopeptide (TPR) repeat protein